MKEIVNPNMVVLARESRGLTQSELAQELDVFQAIISRIEAGLMPVSDMMLDKFADTLRYPKEFFYEQANIYPLGVHFYRKAKGISSKDLTMVKATTNIDRIRMEHLLQSANFKVKDIPMCEIDGERYKNPEDVARAVRLAWSLPSGRIENVTRALEDAGILVMFCNLNTRYYDAHSVSTENGRFIAFANSSRGGDRIRFSLAHELGHIVMHRIPHEHTEEEANRFAAEFLMPEQDISYQLTNLTLEKLANLKKHWKVSMQALLKRAETLRRITNRQYHYLWMQMGKLGYRLSEPSVLDVSPEKPSLVQEIVNMYLTELNYTPTELKRILYLDDEDYTRFNTTHSPNLRVVSKVHKINADNK